MYNEHKMVKTATNFAKSMTHSKLDERAVKAEKRLHSSFKYWAAKKQILRKGAM